MTGRWILAGLSCTSFTVFLVWLLITLGGFVPLFFVSGYWIFFEVDTGQGKQDCAAIFGDDGHDFARGVCDVRLWSYIVGVIFVLISVAGPVTIGLIDYARICCLPRRRAWVAMPSYWRNLISPQNPDYRGTAAANDDSLATQPLVTDAGYRSATTPFYNWSIEKAPVSLTVAANQVGNV